MKKTLTAFSFLLAAFLSFTATAMAANAAAPTDGSLLDLARPVFDAVMHGNYWLAAAGAVILMTAATRKYLPDAYGGKFARGDVGGMITAFLLAGAGAVATTMAAPGAAMSAAVMLTAGKIGLSAVGGFVALHKLATWFTGTKFWADHTPAWLKALVAMALNLIGSSALAKAEKAGQKAVDESPAPGASGPTGNVTEI